MPHPARHPVIHHGALLPFALLVVFGLATLGAWWAGEAAWVQPRLRDVPLPANAAACLALLGLSPLAAAAGWRRTATVFAGLAALLAGLAVADELLGRAPGFDNLLAAHARTVDGPAIGRMPLALGAALAAVAALVGWQSFRPAGHPARGPLLALAGSLLAAYAISALLAGRTGLHIQPAWQEHARLGPPAALGLLALGAGLLVLAARDRPGSGAAGRWLWMPVIACGSTVTVLFWFALHERELAYVNGTTRLTIDNVAALYAAEGRAKIESLRRMAARWTHADGAPPAVWEQDAVAQFADFAPYRALQWVDTGHRTRWLYPTVGNEDSVGLDHGAEPARLAALQEVRRTGAAAVAGPLESPLRPPFFAVYAPVARAGGEQGFVVGEIYYGALFELVVKRLELAPRVALQVTIGGDANTGTGGHEVFASDLAALESAGRRQQVAVYTLLGQRVTFRMAPRAEAGGSRIRAALPGLALASGLGVSLLLGLVVHLALAAHLRRQAAEKTSLELGRENEQRRRAEARLQVADERLNLALNATLVGVFEWDVPSGRVFYTPSVWQSLGYDPATRAGTAQAWSELIHPDDQPAFQRANESHFRGESELIELEYRVRQADGEWAWVAARAKCVAFDTTGRPLRVIGTCQNVTARRKADEALRTSQAATRMLSHVASRTENPVVITAADGTIEWANESFSRLTGFAVAEVRGALLLDLLASPDQDPRALERVTAALVNGQPITTDVAALSQDKERRYHLRLELQPVRNEAGAVENFIALATDMTARVETENELRRAKAEADAASRAKSDFLASMSHEIRTPMNGVIGMTSLLLETELTPEQRDYVSTIRTSGDALLVIINEILDFSKIESGKMELERQPFELAQCLEEALDIFALQAAAKGIELAYYLDPAVPPWIEGDMARLRQVLVNLVNNAVKFTPQGSVTVEVHVSTVETAPGFRVVHEEGGRLLLDFFVADTGIGIPRDRQHLLFKPFSQVDTSTTRKFGGTGLGLAICDRLCHLMGGSIDVTSKPGEGSTFRFSIQATPVAALVEEVLPALPARLHGRHVLIMDDHAINRANLGRAVATLGLAPLETHNLYNAAELAVQHKLAAAVIDDIGEYGEKGSMLAQELREQHPKLPIVLYLSPVDNVRRSDSGDPFLVRLTKPVKPALLRQVLAQLFQEPDAAETRPPMPMSDDTVRLAAALPLDILLVEDNPVNQKVALRFLERLGYRADAVGNGLEAVRTLQQRDYDLVFMDVQMPEMDGFTATREIRAKLPADRQPKIVALTANAVQGDRERCLAAGMDDYLSKPVKLEALEQVIRKSFGDGAR